MPNKAAGPIEQDPIPASSAEILTKLETAQLMRCSLRFLDDLLDQEVIPCIRLGRRVLFRRSAVMAALEKLEG